MEFSENQQIRRRPRRSRKTLVANNDNGVQVGFYGEQRQ